MSAAGSAAAQVFLTAIRPPWNRNKLRRMVAPFSDRPDDNAPAASPGERLYVVRYLLAVAFGALLIASLRWGVPLVFSAVAFLLMLAVTAFVPRRPVALRNRDDTSGAQLRPDTSMQVMLDALPQAGFILDGAGTVRSGNPRAAALFPATREGDPFTLTFRWPEIADALDEAVAGRATSIDFHEPGTATSVYSVALSPLKLLEHPGNFILVTFADVSDRQAVARMRADFVANASHELRTPLASLTGFIETLLGPARNDPQAIEKFLVIMLDQARRMRRLIDDLLSLSRVEMRVYSRPTDRVGLIPLLRQVRDALGPLASEHSVELQVDAPEGEVEVIGDRDELVQVFQNLIENAIRYGASGGRVDIRLELRSGDRVAVHVQDYGPGIAPEHLPRLTERFYRVDVGASRDMKGTGLGLAIVKHILTRHQGRLEVQSRPGEGARFTAELPYPQAVGEEKRETQAAATR
jgi:two-component system phosphate regulon sensor histidine kinase PhoR